MICVWFFVILLTISLQNIYTKISIILNNIVTKVSRGLTKGGIRDSMTRHHDNDKKQSVVDSSRFKEELKSIVIGLRW